MSEQNYSGRHPASFRDPCGFVFQNAGTYYRAVMPEGRADYDRLIQSGLYAELLRQGWIIAHNTLPDNTLLPEASLVLQPEQLYCWTYPYEWTFHQLRAAALLTLRLLRTGLQHSMILKDASAFNIQFVGSRPVLIDSLSFEGYEEGTPWQAFRQFCQHFLYPLFLLQQSPELPPSFWMAFSDGLPARVTASLLPWKSRLNWNKQLYVFLAAKLSRKQGAASRSYRISKQKILQNVAHLEDLIQGLKPRQQPAVWANYYDQTILSNDYLTAKQQVLEEWLQSLHPARVIDVGCNTGSFSLLAAKYAKEVIAFDADAPSVDQLFCKTQSENIAGIYSLVADFSNPTPALGWANAERSALLDRLRGDVVLALALVHHLAIAGNLPFHYLSECFARICTGRLIVEFVPKSDPKTQLLLQARKDIFPDYHQAAFEAAFAQHFEIEKCLPLPHSERLLYLMRKR